MNNVELKFPNDLHNFKQASKRRNRQGEHKYVCESCGIIGWVRPDTDTILIKKGNKDAIENCSNAEEGKKTKATIENKNIGLKIVLKADIVLGDFTAKKGTEHTVVECPDSHKKEYNLDTWIKVQDEFVRLFEGEYEFVVKHDDDGVVIEEEPITTEEIEVEEEVSEHEEVVENSDKQVDEHIEDVEEGSQEIGVAKDKTSPDKVEDVEDKTYDNLKKKSGVVLSTVPDEFKDGKFNLENDDKIDYGFRMAEAEHKIFQFNQDLKREKKKFKDLIDEQQKVVDDLGSAIINGFEFRDILCELYLDYDKGKRLWRDKANGNVIKIEDMKPEDYQMDFQYKEEEDGDDR
ncbi:MAG: hypothetical protein U9O94_10765 [Nanoarchaeota archaeon]|nr:hypothetical protein [Nanoarchaeota archaeon]